MMFMFRLKARRVPGILVKMFQPVFEMVLVKKKPGILTKFHVPYSSESPFERKTILNRKGNLTNFILHCES
jgi:hypothetical protein